MRDVEWIKKSHTRRRTYIDHSLAMGRDNSPLAPSDVGPAANVDAN
jgi:hypothetical protein